MFNMEGETGRRYADVRLETGQNAHRYSTYPNAAHPRGHNEDREGGEVVYCGLVSWFQLAQPVHHVTSVHTLHGSFG